MSEAEKRFSLTRAALIYRRSAKRNSLSVILNLVGTIQEERTEESLSKLNNLLRTAINRAQAKDGPAKRVRILLGLDESPASE